MAGETGSDDMLARLVALSSLRSGTTGTTPFLGDIGLSGSARRGDIARGLGGNVNGIVFMLEGKITVEASEAHFWTRSATPCNQLMALSLSIVCRSQHSTPERWLPSTGEAFGRVRARADEFENARERKRLTAIAS